jgi:YbbR domain-containing protein
MAYHPFRHIGLKTLAVVIAVLLWLTVSGERIVERSLRIPLELENVPEYLEIVDNPPGMVDVRVRGGSSVLGHLLAGDMVAVIDLSTARPGRRLFHVTPDDVRAPFGIEVSQVAPATVPLAFERVATRTVPVVPSVEGRPANGYAVQSVAADPSSVEVVGPEGPLAQLREAITEPVSVDGATSTVRESATIGVPTASLRLKSPRNAIVTVTIQAQPVDRAFKDVPVRTRNLSSRHVAQVSPAVVGVTLRATPAPLDRLTADAIPAWVDLAGLGRGRYNLRIRVDPPKGTELSRVDPPTVSITIR